MEQYSPLINEDEEGFEKSRLAWKRKGGRCYQIRLPTAILSLMLIISSSCNIFLLLPTQNSTNYRTPKVPQQGTHWGIDSLTSLLPYLCTNAPPAGLVRNVSVPIYSSTEYGPAVGTQEERDALWGALDISPGTIALSDEYAAQNGLPRSQRFPWDESKGTYIIGAFHQMHCLVSLGSKSPVPPTTNKDCHAGNPTNVLTDQDPALHIRRSPRRPARTPPLPPRRALSRQPLTRRVLPRGRHAVVRTTTCRIPVGLRALPDAAVPGLGPAFEMGRRVQFVLQG